MERKRLLDLELDLVDHGPEDFLSNLASFCHATLIKYSRKGIYKCKNHIRLYKVKNITVEYHHRRISPGRIIEIIVVLF